MFDRILRNIFETSKKYLEYFLEKNLGGVFVKKNTSFFLIFLLHSFCFYNKTF